MSTETFLHVPEKPTAVDLWWWRHWLPAWEQIRTALELHVDRVIAFPDDAADSTVENSTGENSTVENSTVESDADDKRDQGEAEGNRTVTSMRQGLGLVVATALLGGVLPFLVNWFQAARIGTALPLVLWARYAAEQSSTATAHFPFVEAWTDAVRTVAGLSPMLPGWLAAGLSALGAWMNWPLTWLTFWLVYGLGVLAATKVQGATTTLPHFYAATSYAFVPLVLWGLRPLPYIGILFSLAGLLWAVLIYAQAVRTLSHLSTLRLIVSLLAPLAIGLLAGLTVLGLIALVFLPLLI